ncbi:MAG TPA: hypothetical protein VFW40_06070 [Capsulimonadaceae bacterium]|nr:hypothetical protein [Capsulimonadaceae bacterium]
MASTYTYRSPLLLRSWMVAVNLSAQALPLPEEKAHATEASPGIWLSYQYEPGPNTLRPLLQADERNFLALGLRLVADQISATAKHLPALIHVEELTFGLCDYQPEGLACAMAGWAAQEFGFAKPRIPVTADRDKRRYVFHFDQTTFASSGESKGAM